MYTQTYRNKWNLSSHKIPKSTISFMGSIMHTIRSSKLKILTVYFFESFNIILKSNSKRVTVTVLIILNFNEQYNNGFIFSTPST